MTTIKTIRGDIMKIYVDAIVNAANPTLLGGGGVDGAIHDAAGLELLEECGSLGGCAPGEVKITKGYNLPARFVIHTVGPIYGFEHGNEAELLAACYRNSLELAMKHGVQSIAFPAISTGAFGYPKDEAKKIAENTVRAYVAAYPTGIDKIIFVEYEVL